MSLLFLYFAKTQHENLGDRLIARTLLHNIRNYGRVVLNVKGCPVDYKGELKNDCYKIEKENYLFFLLKYLVYSKVKNIELFVIMKPGHFYGLDGGFINKFVQTLTIIFFGFLGVKFCRFGASVGPFEKHIEFLEIVASKFYYKYTARENLSIEYCKRIGVKNVEFFPDFAFAIPGHIAVNIVESSQRENIVFSFRSSRYIEKNSGIAHLRNLIIGLNLKEYGCKNSLFISQVTRDYSIMSKLFPDNEIFVYPNCSSDEIFEHYNKSLVVVSNRLHSLLFAAFCGCLPIALVSSGENKKIVGVFQAIGLDFLILNIEDPCINDKITHIVSNLNQYKIMLDEVFKDNRMKIFNELDSIFKGCK